MKIKTLQSQSGFLLIPANEEEKNDALTFLRSHSTAIKIIKLNIEDFEIMATCFPDDVRDLGKLLLTKWPECDSNLAPKRPDYGVYNTPAAAIPSTVEEIDKGGGENFKVLQLQADLNRANARIKDFEESNNATQRRTMCLSMAMQQGHGFRFDLMSPTENDKKYDVFRVAEMIEAYLYPKKYETVYEGKWVMGFDPYDSDGSGSCYVFKKTPEGVEYLAEYTCRIPEPPKERPKSSGLKRMFVSKDQPALDEYGAVVEIPAGFKLVDFDFPRQKHKGFMFWAQGKWNSGDPMGTYSHRCLFCVPIVPIK